MLRLVVGSLVGLALLALLDSISVFIGPSPREGETRRQQSPPASTATRIGPCPTIIQISGVKDTV